MTLIPFRSAWLSAAAFACLGCASYSPRPLAPADELALLRASNLAELQIEYSVAGAQAAPVPRAFNAEDGLDEPELAALALTLNPGLRAKRAGVGEAQALLISAGLLPNPDLGAFVRSGVGGVSGSALGLDAMFALLRPDERPAKRAIAESQIELVRAEIATEERRLVSRVRRARIGVLAAEQALRLFEQELAVRTQAVTLVRKQRELGEATELALALVELDRATVERGVREARASTERERRALHALLGVPPESGLELVGSGGGLVFTIAEDPSDAQLDARLIAESSELRARAADYRQAEAELRLAVSMQFPGMTLGPTFEKDTGGSEGLGLGASIELPLFDRNQGGIASKEALRERKRLEYVAALHELRACAFDARSEVRLARGEVELEQREVLPLVQRTEALFEGALRARELSVFEWLAARSRAIQARRDLLDALTRYALAVVDLDSAVGSPLVVVVSAGKGEDSKR
ncbi:MAG: TolC family protein [Planctomycetes bacterium]|nr:TolC family protein [Planctomycetota bacterium]